MKSIFFFFILVIATMANSASNTEERDGGEGSCDVSQECRQEVVRYNVCQNGLSRGLTNEKGPCIKCSDESTCCCGDKDRSEGICGISEQCQDQIDNCQGEDRNHMAEASLGCADGSRCWCFNQ